MLRWRQSSDVSSWLWGQKTVGSVQSWGQDLAYWGSGPPYLSGIFRSTPARHGLGIGKAQVPDGGLSIRNSQKLANTIGYLALNCPKGSLHCSRQWGSLDYTNERYSK